MSDFEKQNKPEDLQIEQVTIYVKMNDNTIRALIDKEKMFHKVIGLLADENNTLLLSPPIKGMGVKKIGDFDFKQEVIADKNGEVKDE